MRADDAGAIGARLRVRFPAPLTKRDGRVSGMKIRRLSGRAMWNTICLHHRLQLRYFGWRLCWLGCHPPSSAIRLWVYTRKHAFIVGELFFDRRDEFCQLPRHTKGPCSGLPRPDCPGYENWLAHQ